MSKYWNNEGRYQAEFDKLSNELMPAVGKAGSLAGELVRSANRLYYDAFNNGFCNNTSGAANFLDTFAKPRVNDIKFTLALSLIASKANTGCYSTVDESTMTALDLIVDSVCELIAANPEFCTVPTPYDMFELQDATYYENQEEEDEEEDSW